MQDSLYVYLGYVETKKARSHRCHSIAMATTGGAKFNGGELNQSCAAFYLSKTYAALAFVIAKVFFGWTRRATKPSIYGL